MLLVLYDQNTKNQKSWTNNVVGTIISPVWRRINTCWRGKQESLSFAYRALKTGLFTDFVLALQKRSGSRDQALLLSIFEAVEEDIMSLPSIVAGSAEFCGHIFK